VFNHTYVVYQVQGQHGSQTKSDIWICGNSPYESNVRLSDTNTASINSHRTIRNI
jgi:hypothetical protein